MAHDKPPQPLNRGPRAGGLADQVVALGDVCGPMSGLGVGRSGGREVAAELVQVAADGVSAVPLAEHLAQPVGLAQAAIHVALATAGFGVAA